MHVYMHVYVYMHHSYVCKWLHKTGYALELYAYARGGARRSPQKKRIFTMIEFTDQHLLILGIVCLYMPCDAADVTVATLACTPLAVWRSRSFLCLALGDAVLIVIDVFAIAYAPKHVSGSECALIGLLENILAPLWVFARFGDVPSAWTVAGGALLLATLIGHEVAAREPVRVSQPGARGYRTVNNL